MASGLGNRRQMGHLDQGRLTSIAHSQRAVGAAAGQRSIYPLAEGGRILGRRGGGHDPHVETRHAIPRRGGRCSYWRAYREKALSSEGRARTQILSSGDIAAMWVALRLYPLVCYPIRVAEE